MTSADSTKPAEPLTPGEDWTTPLPANVPRPTIWPAGLAFGLTLLVWGLVTSTILIAVGGLVFGASIVGWIGDLRHEQRQS